MLSRPLLKRKAEKMMTTPYPGFGILLVDDEPAWLNMLSITLERCAGINNIKTCTDSSQVMSVLARQQVGMVLLDLTMPHPTGEELLRQISEAHPEIVTIIISGMDQVANAVRCMKLGAFDYFIKTDEEDRIVGGVLRAVRMLEMRQENQEMSHRVISGELRQPQAFAEIITADRGMLAIFSYLEAIARSPQPLLIGGASGTGKELLAAATHNLSGCSGKLVTVNVAGLDDTVFSDTLFGHVRGAFTGADTARRGMVEEAQHGTLFLDEIGDLSTASQVKLLRLLQEGEYFALGSDRPKRLQARIIVATHQNLKAKEMDGSFRRDLYYRLSTHQVRLPALKERRGDIRLLLEHFIAEAATALEKKAPTPTQGLVQYLETYDFPGNIRELRSMVFDAVSINLESRLTLEPFATSIDRSRQALEGEGKRHSGPNPFAGFDQLPTFAEAGEFLVLEALDRAKGNQTLAARLLGISQPALNKRLKRLRD